MNGIEYKHGSTVSSLMVGVAACTPSLARGSDIIPFCRRGCWRSQALILPQAKKNGKRDGVHLEKELKAPIAFVKAVRLSHYWPLLVCSLPRIVDYSRRGSSPRSMATATAEARESTSSLL